MHTTEGHGDHTEDTAQVIRQPVFSVHVSVCSVVLSLRLTAGA
jgi:hypothetical protein